MSAYPPPINPFDPVFNISNFQYSVTGLDVATANLLYLQLSGGTLAGSCTFALGLTSVGILGVSNSLEATSTSSGSLTTLGGVGVAKTLYANAVNTNTLTVNTSTVFPSGITTNQINNPGPITVPTSAGDTVALLNAPQTLVNKTITSPSISQIQNGGTISIPTGTDSLVARTSSDNLTNKTFPAGFRISTGFNTGYVLTSDSVGNAAWAALPSFSGLFPNGTAALPSISFTNSTASGMYLIAGNDMGFSTNGLKRLEINTSNIIGSLPYVSPSGTVSTPSYTFQGDTTTGLYLFSSGVLGITLAGGVGAATFSQNTLTGPQYWCSVPGSAAAPAIYLAQGNVGLYTSGTNILNFASNNTNILQMSNTQITATVPIANTSAVLTTPSIVGLNGNQALYSKKYTGGSFLVNTTSVLPTTLTFTGFLSSDFNNGSAVQAFLLMYTDLNTAFSINACAIFAINLGGQLRVSAGPFMSSNITSFTLTLSGSNLVLNIISNYGGSSVQPVAITVLKLS